MKHIILPALLLLAGYSLSAQCVFISEYLEGSGNNKCIEIYNGTAASIDLAAGGYALKIYANGNAAPTATISLSGSVAPGDVFVLCHPGAAPALLAQADQTSGAYSVNGDDAIALVFSGGTLDVLGQPGLDPGTEWTGSGCPQGTADATLVRKPALICPSFDGLATFDPSVEWECYPMDTFSDLGAHFLASCVLYDLSVSAAGCNNGTATALLDFTSYNPGGAAFTLTVSPDPGGLSGSYLYADLPLLLSGFAGNNVTPYSFAIADNTSPGCVSDTVTGVVFDCPVADQLIITQMPPGCAETNQGLTFEVCAVEGSSGKIQPDFGGVITVSADAPAGGTLSGNLSQAAVNGCAVFSLAYNLPETISLTFSNGIFSDVQTSLIPYSVLCPSAVITTAVINPCGNDSQNEYFGMRTGDVPFSVDELVVSSIDPVIGVQPNTNFVWSASGTQDGNNPAESCGAIGLQCNRILDINLPGDSAIIASQVAQLNAQAGCGAPLFVAPAGPNLGNLPAHANVVFFLGAGGNASLPLAPGFDGLGSNIDFSVFCGQGPVYALFGYHKNPTAAFGFFSNTASRTYQLIVAGNITSEITYSDPAGNLEAEIIDSAGVYSEAADCTPLSLFRDQVLALEWLWLDGYSPDGQSVVLNWSVAGWADGKGKFVVERYTDSGFVAAGVVKMSEYSDQPGNYSYTDHFLSGITQAYRIMYVGADGERELSSIVQIPLPKIPKLTLVKVWPNPVKKDVWFNIYNPHESRNVEIHFSGVSGNSIFICRLSLVKGVNTIALDMSDIPGGFCLYRIISRDDVITGRLVIQ
ncbi:MAG: lamin tail domain-containing protein [Bacteroidia bacterium]